VLSPSHGGGVPVPRHGFRVLLKTHDERLAREITRVGEERGYEVSRLETLRDLPGALAASRPSVLVLDADESLEHGTLSARTAAAAYPTLPIVLVTDDPATRSEEGFRLVDRWRTGERIVDALELAHIGIPAHVEDSFLPARLQ
jgi:hypothetical protein